MSANDMKAAEKTYGGFIASLKWAVPLIALIALVVVVLIAD
ncbi:aa3-type cytochrome c oxidase subunit IV [Erythrobacter sp. HKB08]|nr:aa3-type cytochrome c oxidase subunit IV [Erythrobacter sp. HKB08]